MKAKAINKLVFSAATFIVCLCLPCLVSSQPEEIELSFDLAGNVVALPKIFMANIDISGRGFHGDVSWPQTVGAKEVLDSWQQDIGFRGIYRLQYNLWEISQLAKNKKLQAQLLANYENIMKRITDSGGIVLLDIFSIPQGQGKVLDKKSTPVNLRLFKEIIKSDIKRFSCERKFNVWYEVWSAPDLDDFFLGRQQEYLAMYKAVAESAMELEKEFKVHIPVGGPSTSWWFRSLEDNTIATPERSLVYELIRFCYRYRLPLNFISWHAYSTDPKAEKETTSYNKYPASLIRDWLSYFHFDKNTPIVIDEWNYDSGANLLSERKESSNVCASYIPSRIKNMSEAGIDYQTFFSLEDFQDNREGINRNTGVFWFEQQPYGYKGGAKAVYNVYKMINSLGSQLIVAGQKNADEFVGMIPTKTEDGCAVLIYNYIDPFAFQSFISRSVASLTDGEKKSLLSLVKSNSLEKIRTRELDISKLRVRGKVKQILKKALEANDMAQKYISNPRKCSLEIKNLKENYSYQRYIIDGTCALNCGFVALEKKDIAASDAHRETFELSPHSVSLIILKQKPQSVETAVESDVKEVAAEQQPEPAAVTDASVQPVSAAANITEQKE